MKLRLEDKREAIRLRKEGYSYNEIRQFIPDLSKSTLSGWLKNVKLSHEQEIRIQNKIKSGSTLSHIKGAWSNRQKALLRIENIYKLATEDYRTLSNDKFFMIGLSLYWAEGAKKSRFFQFMNSDPRMIKLMIKWLTKTLDVPVEDIKIRIFIHKVYESEDCESFWSITTGIAKERFKKTIYKPSVHKVKKNLQYKGCCRLEITKSEIFWKINRWIELLSSEY